MSVQEFIKKLKETGGALGKLDEPTRVLASEIGRILNPNYKPTTWGKTSIAPYYTETNAKAIKELIDRLVKSDLQSLFIPSSTLHVNRSTAIARINQAWQWLIDNDERKDFYKRLRGLVSTHKELDGIRLSFKEFVLFKEDYLEGSMLEPPPDAKTAWRTAFAEYIANAPDNTVFEKRGLNLTDADQKYITTLVHYTENFYILKMTKSSFVVCRNDSYQRRHHEKSA